MKFYIIEKGHQLPQNICVGILANCQIPLYLLFRIYRSTGLDLGTAQAFPLSV